MAEELVPIQENDYKELLLQTVAVIEHARVKVARHITATANISIMRLKRNWLVLWSSQNLRIPDMFTYVDVVRAVN